jgi:hypothetical protein
MVGIPHNSPLDHVKNGKRGVNNILSELFSNKENERHID